MGLLIAISGLGLGTSLIAIAALGWCHVSATVIATTLVILGVVTGGVDDAALSGSRNPVSIGAIGPSGERS